MSSAKNRSGISTAWRISIWTTLAFALSTIVAFGLLCFVVANSMRQRSDAWLVGEGDTLSEVAASTPRDALYDRIVSEAAELATREVAARPGAKDDSLSNVFFLQTDATGKPLLWVGPGDSKPLLQVLNATPLDEDAPRSVLIPAWDKTFRIVEQHSAGGTIQYLGISQAIAFRSLNNIIKLFAISWLVIVALGFCVSYFSMRSLLARVQEVTRTAARIGRNDLDSRVPEGESNDEIGQLAETFNRMLDRIQGALHQLHTMTGALAHDLKSPITAVRGQLELALSSNESLSRETVAGAIDRLDSLSELLNISLDIAEAGADALRLRREPFDLTETTLALVDLYRPSFIERRIEINIHAEPEIFINADAGLLQRVLVNLLQNELQHLDENTEVNFTIRRVGPDVEFTVEDNGGGFPQEVTDNMFQRRAKGKQSTGHGLGLAFVDSVLRAHDGRVTAGRSSSGGAKLQFTLPAMAAAPAIADVDRREVAHS